MSSWATALTSTVTSGQVLSFLHLPSGRPEELYGCRLGKRYL